MENSSCGANLIAIFINYVSLGYKVTYVVIQDTQRLSTVWAMHACITPTGWNSYSGEYFMLKCVKIDWTNLMSICPSPTHVTSPHTTRPFNSTNIARELLENFAKRKRNAIIQVPI